MVEKSLKPKVAKPSPHKDDLPSIFRARAFGSLLDQDEDCGGEEEDILTLRLANPILDEEGTDFLSSPLCMKNSICQPITILLSSCHDRLTEDELKGFSLGGLIFV